MATLQDYLGITALRDAWPKWKANVIAINNQVINHVAGSADKHSAQDITYTGAFVGKTEVKAALDQAKTEIDTIVVNASVDPEVALARDSTVKGETFDTLDARLEESEQDFESYKADNANIEFYGAHSITDVGYETFDSTLAIQAALDNGIAVIPQGLYLYTPPLMIRNSSSGIVGINREKCVLQPTELAVNAIEIGADVSVSIIKLKDFTLLGNDFCNNGIVIGSASNAATWIQADNIDIRNFEKLNADGLQINRTWWFTFSGCIFQSNYNNIHCPDGSVSTTVVFKDNTEIRRALNIGFLSDGPSVGGDAFIFDKVSFELNVNGAIHCTNPKTRTILNECYFESNNNTINITGADGLYMDAFLYMKNCVKHGADTGYSINLDYTKGNIIDCHNFYTSASPILTTAHTSFFFEHIRNRSASDFLTYAKTLPGRISAKETYGPTGNDVYYSSFGHIFDGHLDSQGVLPTVIAGDASGTDATVVLREGSTDTSGIIDITFGASGWIADNACLVTFAKAYIDIPSVVITPFSVKAGKNMMTNSVYAYPTLDKFRIVFGIADTEGGVSSWSYIIMK